MLVEDKLVIRAFGNERLGEAPRYMAGRFAELLDPTTHYSRAAAAVVDPLTGVREYDETARGFMNEDGTHFSAVIDFSRQLSRLLGLERNCSRWYPTERKRLSLRLKDLPRGIPNYQGADAKRNAVLKGVRRILRTELPAFERVLSDPATGFRARLLDQIGVTLVEPPTTAPDWLRFDGDLLYLATVLLAEGRDPTSTAFEVASVFAEAESDQEAIDGFRSIVHRSPSGHGVAVTLRGTNSAANAASFGCEPAEPATWSGGSAPANRRLRDFSREMKRGGRAATFLVRVDAWDFRHARALGLSKAQQLADYVSAEHRLSHIDVDPAVLVHCERDGGVERVTHERSSVKKARTIQAAPVAQLAAPLRFSRLARQERAAAVAVVHSWIALEGLVEGARIWHRRDQAWKPQPPGSYIPQNVAALMPLAATRNQVIWLWQLLQRLAMLEERERFNALKRWLGLSASQTHVDLDRWLELVIRADGTTAPADSLAPEDSVEQAAAWVRDLAERLGPYPLQTFEQIRQRLSSGGQLSNWCGAIERTAAINLTRMKLLRHRVVHRGKFDDDHALQIAEAARDILDGVFEVILHWLPGRAAPWEAIRDARAHREQLGSAWNNAGANPKIEPTRLVAP
jgi:hypothetical protein